MTRYQAKFRQLAARNEGAFVPFVVLGDPDPESSLAILEALVAGGADMLELGIPFSDPIADGPAIQAADLRALRGGTTPAGALALLAQFRRRHPALPIGLLIYANLIHRAGLPLSYRRFAAAGVDSVLIADLPLEEAGPFRAAAAAAGVGAVAMVTPLTGPARLARIVALGGPYLYAVSRTGVTGRDASLAATAAPLLRRIRRAGRVPTLLGFGISRPEQVREAVAAGASGAISGSAAVEIIGRHASGGTPGRRKRSALVEELRGFTQAMKAGTR